MWVPEQVPTRHLQHGLCCRHRFRGPSALRRLALGTLRLPHGRLDGRPLLFLGGEPRALSLGLRTG